MSAANWPFASCGEYIDAPSDHDPRTDDLPYPADDAFEGDVLALVSLVRKLNVGQATLAEVLDAADEVAEWYESDDPRSMGWVDDLGRP